MYEGGDGKNRETFSRIPDEPSKPRNFSPLKLLSFMVANLHTQMYLLAKFQLFILKAFEVTALQSSS